MSNWIPLNCFLTFVYNNIRAEIYMVWISLTKFTDIWNVQNKY